MLADLMKMHLYINLVMIVGQRLDLKAMKKFIDVAAELLDVYAQREVKKGFAFQYDKKNLNNFLPRFLLKKRGSKNGELMRLFLICAEKAMDRLVCGDVGFGKTEVAMRAAFLAVMNHKQVAVLVPTTLLAQQHRRNFKDRFCQSAG